MDILGVKNNIISYNVKNKTYLFSFITNITYFWVLSNIWSNQTLKYDINSAYFTIAQLMSCISIFI